MHQPHHDLTTIDVDAWRKNINAGACVAPAIQVLCVTCTSAAAHKSAAQTSHSDTVDSINQLMLEILVMPLRRIPIVYSAPHTC
jgi:hypothetical protein